MDSLLLILYKAEQSSCAAWYIEYYEDIEKLITFTWRSRNCGKTLLIGTALWWMSWRAHPVHWFIGSRYSWKVFFFSSYVLSLVKLQEDNYLHTPAHSISIRILNWHSGHPKWSQIIYIEVTVVPVCTGGRCRQQGGFQLKWVHD